MPAQGIQKNYIYIYLAHNLDPKIVFSIALVVREIDPKRALSVKLLFFDCFLLANYGKSLAAAGCAFHQRRTQQSALLVIRKRRDNS